MRAKLETLIKLSVVVLITLSCTVEQKTSPIRKIVTDYYTVYKARNDFQAFLSFYEEEMVMEDMINGDRLVGKKAFADFFNWNDPGFSLIDSIALVVQEQIIENKTVVTKGYFTAFQYGGTDFEAMQFTTILTFNESGKIIKQIDWINYPSTLINYESRKNSNKWILKE